MTLDEVQVNPTAASGVLHSPISQDPLLDARCPPYSTCRGGQERGESPCGSRGQPTYALFSSRVYTNIQRSRRVSCETAEKVGSVTGVANGLLAATSRVHCHVTRTKMKKGIAACSGKIDPESSARYVCCYVIQ